MSVPAEVLAAFGMTEAEVTPVTRGLINATFSLRGPRGPFILQQVSPIFSPAVHDDIQAVTRHLFEKGMRTPLLIPTEPEGALCFVHEDRVWRCLSFIEGTTFDHLGSPNHAKEAGALLARFHGALVDLKRSWKGQRIGVHDTDRHLETLRRAVDTHTSHSLHQEVGELAEVLFRRASDLPRFGGIAPRVVHGDPKINNIVFDTAGKEALCFVDLDTVGPMALPLELGDAFRSWCNPAGENKGPVTFSLDLFRAAIQGYAEEAVDFITAPELMAISNAIPLIMVELSTRFAADALNESYFGWDPSRFASRGAHNLARAQVQLQLAESYLEQQEDVDDIIGVTFRRASSC